MTPSDFCFISSVLSDSIPPIQSFWKLKTKAKLREFFFRINVVALCDVEAANISIEIFSNVWVIWKKDFQKL